MRNASGVVVPNIAYMNDDILRCVPASMHDLFHNRVNCYSVVNVHCNECIFDKFTDCSLPQLH